jgi:amino acid transporter
MDGRSSWLSQPQCGLSQAVSNSPICEHMCPHGTSDYQDDSAAHISEETAGAARVAPIAILVGVGATASLGWLLFIAASFATTSVSATLSSTLPLPMGQLFFDVLGKRGMLAIWSFIIVVQVFLSPLGSFCSSMMSI